MAVSLAALRREQIERRRQQSRDYRLAMRLSTLLWHDKRKAESEIAHLLGVCQRTVRTWLRLNSRKGWLPSAPYTTRALSALTSSQAEQLTNEIQTDRDRCAPRARRSDTPQSM